MIRLPIPPERLGPEITLTAEERHYLVDVMRLRPGAAIEVFDGAARRFRAVLQAYTLRLEDELPGPRPIPPITLGQALVKGDKMELVIQKATELGVAAIAPFASERAVVHLTGTKAADRVERWRKIAASAAAQSGRVEIPDVLPIAELDALIDRAVEEGTRVVLLYEEERTTRLSEAVSDQDKDEARDEDSPLLLLVGPEGGFSEREVERARAGGARVATLGERILRTETAGLAALAVVLHRRGALG